MPNKSILKQSLTLLVLIGFSVLAWGDQKKTSAPAPQKTAATSKTAAPASKPAASMPSSPAVGNNKPVVNSNNKPVVNSGNKPVVNSGNKPVVNSGNKPVVNSGNSKTSGRKPPRTIRPFTDSSGHAASASFRPGGQVATIQANGLTINHGLHGGRTIVSEHNGHTIVSTGGHDGYVQRTYVTRNGHAYVQRTYMVGGHPYAQAYRVYEYGGVRYYGYVPVYYYQPVFYGWAYNPWVAPVYYGPAAWGWVGTPWFGFYGGYFTPYPVYPTASLWLTDYVIAANLQAAYQAQGEAPAATGNTVTVPSHAGPWDLRLNPAFPYGAHDQEPPVRITAINGAPLSPGSVINVSYLGGTVSAGADWPQADANGAVSRAPASGQPRAYPSRYMDPSTYPIYVASLVGTFARDGVIVGRPFRVGDAALGLTVPDGANELLLGVNDDVFGDNSGAWMVGVTLASPGTQGGPETSAGPPQTGGNGYSTQLSPEIKQAIADEVKSQLAAEQAAASNPTATSSSVPPALDPATPVFVVAKSLDVTEPDTGQECSLTAGDVVNRQSVTPDDNQNVPTKVESSKKADCTTGKTVAVSVQDLQEMHNSFREQLDSGLKALADNSGKNGLPAAPDTTTTAGEVPPPTPDSGAAAQLQEQQQKADETEKDVQAQAPTRSGG